MANPEMYYVNNSGERFTLNGDGLTYTDPKPLRAFSWDYVLSNRLNGYGGRASGFARRPKTVDLEVRTRGFTMAQFKELMNSFLAVSDADCIAETPGKLYVGSQYISCYLAVSGEIGINTWYTPFAYRIIKVLAVEPYWCTDVTTIFNIRSAEEVDTTGKRFNLRFPYRFGSGYSVAKLLNTHYASCPAVLTFYGPADNPSVIINDTVFSVDVTLTSAERLVIDQVHNEIYKMDASGNKTNAFDKRNKAYDIFERIPVGESTLLYDGSFKLSVTLVRQRSELEWV